MKPKPHPSHDVPRAGTLRQISYCRRCGMAFDDTKPCPKAPKPKN